jgi:hypothetical protein
VFTLRTVEMPDHVHLICIPLIDENGSISIPEITQTIKSESAHRINNALTRTGGAFGRMSPSIMFCVATRVSERRRCIFWRVRSERDWLLVLASIGGCGGT